MEGEHNYKREGESEEQPDAKRVKTEEAAAVAAMAAAAGAALDASQQQQQHNQYQAEMDAATAAAHAALMDAATQQQAAEAIAAGMDPAQAAALAAQQAAGTAFTPEQLAALQAQMGGSMMMSPEMMAQMGLSQPQGADAQALQFPMLDPNHQQFFDPSTFPMGLSMDWMQSLPPDQLQALINNPGMAQMLAGGYGMGQYQDPANYKNWWDEKDETELMRFANDKEYCKEKLGTEEMNWEKLEEYFGRSQNALRKKFWMLQKNQGAPMPSDPAYMAFADAQNAAAAAVVAATNPAAFMFTGSGIPSSQPKTRAERKNWTEEETKEMTRIVADPLYRREQGFEEGEEDISWERLAQRFSCSVQTAKRKYRHLQEQAQQFGGIIPEKTKRQHFRKSVPYRWMIVSAMGKMAHLNYESTAPQIFEMIEQDPELQDQLDMRIMPGTKHVPRWKIQVRKVLSADHIFINTGIKQKHETIWRLDQTALQEANADRQRQRAGIPAINVGEHNGAGQNGQGGEGGEHALPIHDLALMQQLQQMQQFMMPDGSLAGMDPSLTDAYLQQLQQLQAGDPAAMAAAAAVWQSAEGAAAMQAMMPGGAEAAAAAMGMDLSQLEPAMEAAAAAMMAQQQQQMEQAVAAQQQMDANAAAMEHHQQQQQQQHQDPAE